MRDKVKRFISILMTALMLVNLMPVGALAEGVTISNSVQSRGYQKPSANVYVYVKVTGDKAGLTINPSGWYTIGKSENVPGMGTPYWSMHGSHSFSDVGVWPDTVLDKKRFTRHADNQKIDLDQITWTEFYVDNGADNYVPAGTYTWHMNGTIDIKQLPSVYTIKYVDYDTNELIDSYEKTGLMGQKPEKITAPDSLKENLYSFYFVNGHPKEQTVDFKKDKGELTFYYRQQTVNVKYSHKDGGTVTRTDDAVQVLSGKVVDGDTVKSPDSVVSTAIPKEGYVFVGWYKQNAQGVENEFVSANRDLTAGDVTNHLNKKNGRYTSTVYQALFVKKSALEYTVYHRDALTKEDIADPETKTATLDQYVAGMISANSQQKSIDGYTYKESPDFIKIPIENGENKLYLYYTRNSYDYTVHYYWNGTTEPVAGDTTGTLNAGDTRTVGPKGIEGYTPVSSEKQTITEGNNEITFHYYKNVELTANSDTKTYNGSEHSVSGFTGAPEDADFSDITVGAKGTNAGTYDAKFPTGTKGTVDGKGKYIVTEATDGWLKINPVETEVVVTITGNTKTVTYNGIEQSITGYDVSIDNELYTEDDFTFSGNAEAKGTDAGTYDMGLTDDQFTNISDNFTNVRFDVTDGWLKINPVETEVVVKIAGNTKTETYNGKEHSVEGYTVTSISNTLYTTNDFTFSGNADAKGTDAGTYPMNLEAGQFSNTNTNFSKVTFEVADGWLKIDPIDEVVVTITGHNDTVTYNGSEQFVKGYDVTIPEDSLYTESDFEFVGEESDKTASGTNAREEAYEMGLKDEHFRNKNTNFKKVTFEITDGWLKIDPRSVTLTSATDSKPYDGTPLTKPDVAVTGDGFANGEGATYDVTGIQTDVGSSDNEFTYTLNEGTKATNYNIELAPGKLEVTPVTEEVIVTITGRTDEMPYDGKEHSVFGYDVTVSNALYNPKEDMQFNGIDADATAKGTDAGTYPIGLTAEHFTNKSNNFTNVTFVVTDGYVKITPRAVTLTSETAGKTYDGKALEKPVVTVGGDGFVEGQVKEIKATGSVTNAGSVANTITFTPDKETFKDGNYAITKTEGTLTIAKRSVLITSQSATKTYDGSALTRPAVTITGDGFVPGELAKAEATGSITNVGSTPNAIQYTTTGAFNAANYSIALSVGTLTVTEKPQPEPRRTFNLTVNYVYQNGKRAAASYNRGGLKNGETFDITSPVIAGYTASETVVSGTIYNRDIKVTVIYTADGVNLDDYGVPLGLGNITMNVGDCFE